MMSPLDQRSALQAADDGPLLEARSPTSTCKVTSAETNGAFTLLEYTVPPHFRGPPPHLHVGTTHTFYIVDGLLVFTRDDETIMASRGASILVLPHVTHACWNPTAAPATFLEWLSPGGGESCLPERLSDAD